MAVETKFKSNRTPSKKKTDGGGEAFPKKEKTHSNKKNRERQRLSRMDLGRLSSRPLTTAVIGSGGWRAWTRFESVKELVGYSGLGASVHTSGETYRTGRITKTGRRDIRWDLVEAAWIAVGTHLYWKHEFERLSRRMDKNKAIVAVSHKLLIAVWHVLTERVTGKHAEPKMVATKLMRWSWE
jgi:transposase